MINANEAEIIAVISGTFEYEGQIYVAAPEYLAQAIAYLDSEGVDATDEQKTKAIAQIYSSVAEGVQDGYIIPATSSANANQETTTASGDGSATSGGDSMGEDLGDVSGDSGDDGEVGDGTGDEELSPEEIEAARIAEEERLAAERAEELKREFERTHNPMVLALEGIGKSEDTEQAALASVQVQSIPYMDSEVRTVSIALAIVCVLTFLLTMWNRAYRNRGHRVRPRRNRHIISQVMAICMAIAMAVLSYQIVYRHGYYNVENLTSSFEKTGYYEEQTTLATTEIRAYTSAIGIPESAIDIQGINSWYRLELKKTVLQTNEEGYFETSVIRNVQKPINDYLSTQDITLTDMATTGLSNMITSIIKGLKAGLSIPGLSAWYESETVASRNFLPSVAVAIGLIIVMGAIIVLAQSHKKHALKYMAEASILSGLAQAGVYITVMIKGSVVYSMYGMVPTQMTINMTRHAGQLLVWIVGMTLLLGVILFMAYRASLEES